MKKLEIENKQIEIIEKLSETTISNFEKILFEFKQDFELDIDKFVKILSLSSNLSIDEIEELDISLFRNLLSNLNIDELDGSEPLPSDHFEYNGIKYKLTKNLDDLKFNVKEVKLIQNTVKQNQNFFIDVLAAILYREENGNLTEESIDQRRKILNDNMTMDYILPFLVKVNTLNAFKS